MKTDYRKLESDLKELLGLMSNFTDHEVMEVEHFLNVGEYGLAFETLCGIVKEEGRTVSNTNVWAFEIEPQRTLTYELARPNRLFRVAFDVANPVAGVSE